MVERSGSIQVRGLRDLRSELKRLGNAKVLEAELATANEYVAEYVADKAEPRMRGLGSMGARAAQTLSASRSGVSARVSLGGNQFPGALGVEFGAIRDRLRATAGGPMRGWNQFQPWRGTGMNAGYALYPTIRENAAQIGEIYYRELDEILSRAFPD